MILAKTEFGQQVLKDRSVALLPRQRSAFILFDGKRSVDEVLRATTGLTAQDVQAMVDQGLLAPAREGRAAAEDAGDTRPSALGAAPVDALPATPDGPIPGKRRTNRTAQQRYSEAYPIATRLTASLGLRGFRLNLAVEHASGYEELQALSPRIREAVGAFNFAELDQALND